MNLLLFIIILTSFINCSPHVHQRNQERVEDGWQSIHYKDGEHHDEYDHEAILGSKDKAREFDSLTPEESKRRLRSLVTVGGMDANRDGFVDKNELIEWVLKSFMTLAEEDGRERLEEEDTDQDGFVTWDEHLKDSFDNEDPTSQENSMLDELMAEDKALWQTADINNDGKLDSNEFPAFNSPEEYPHMHDTLYKQTMLKRDKNKDGFLDLYEYSSDIHGNPPDPKSEHFIVEKDRFHNEYDRDKDGKLNKEEIISWIIPDNRYFSIQ